MAKTTKNSSSRNFALTIILGVFIAIMVITLFNLIVDYAMPGPEYEDYCKNQGPIMTEEECDEVDGTWNEYPNAMKAEYPEGENGTVDPKPRGYCEYMDSCYEEYDAAQKVHNRQTFFVFAIIGFILIVAGLFLKELLLQIVTLPAGAFLVIQAGISNFDDKLAVIIVFTLLIIAAVYLALKKLK